MTGGEVMAGEKLARRHRSLAFSLKFPDLNRAVPGGDTQFVAMCGNHHARQGMGGSARWSGAEQDEAAIVEKRVGVGPWMKAPNQVMNLNRPA